MNARERFLAIATGGLLIVLGGYWTVNQFTTAVDDRRDRLQTVLDRRDQMDEQQMAGEYAANQLGDYVVRALPGKIEKSLRDYSSWLLDLAQQHDFAGVIVDHVSTTPKGDLYDQLTFRVAGKTDMAGWIEFLHDFHANQRLHRIRKWSLRPSKAGQLQAEMTIEVLAMDRRPDGLPLPPPDESALASVKDYRGDILNRNFFEPPNQPPQFQGASMLTATTGRSQTLPLAFTDPDGHGLTYELVDPPQDVDVSISQNGSLTIRSDQPSDVNVTVRVTDDGYPRQTTEQSVAVRVKDPPPPPPAPEPPVKFDEAKQTVMVATLRGRGEDGPRWELWLRIRTRDQTLKLGVGDEFEIGTVQGTVESINEISATLNVDGSTIEIRPNQKLIEAVRGTG